MHHPHGAGSATERGSERRASATPAGQLRISIVILVALMFVGTIGFWLLGDNRSLFDAAYVTAHVLTTVGDSNVSLNGSEKVWEFVLMLCGIVAALYAGGNLVAFLISGEIRRMFGRRQLQTKISRLDDHFIVCGFGRMGRALCHLLHEKHVPFVLIETDPQRTADADAAGYLYLLGSAMTEATLRAARIDQASGLASCLRSDADNVFVTLTARSLNDTLTVIARAENEDAESKMKRAGADRVICTPLLGASRIMTMLLHPAVEELMDLAVSGPELEVSKIRVSQLPTAVGKRLRDLALPQRTGMMVVAIVGAGNHRVFNPPPDSELREDDELIVIGPGGGAAKMLEAFGDG